MGVISKLEFCTVHGVGLFSQNGMILDLACLRISSKHRVYTS